MTIVGDAPEWLAQLRGLRAQPVPGASWSGLVTALWPGGRLRSTEPLVGGLGGLLDRVIAEDATGAERRAVVRRLLPEWSEGPDDVRGEQATLGVLAAHGVPAPRALWSDPEGTVLGRPALAMTDVPGEALGATLDPVGAGLAGRLLAQLHAIPGEAMGHRAPPGDLRQQIRGRLPRPGTETSDVVDRERLRAGLERAADVVPGQPETFLHDDFHPGNVMRDGDRATVIDLTWATRGDPGRDLGYCRMDLSLTAVPGTTEAFLAGYRAAGGLVPEHLWVYDLVAVARCLPTPAQWLQAFHELGRTDLTAAQVERRIRVFCRQAWATGRAQGVLAQPGPV